MELPPDSRFCNRCGAPVGPAATAAEYKQVTVLFADVVHSMDIAAAVGAERLREIMAELLDRSTAVVKRYGGTLSQFTGDGIMAVSAHRLQWRTTRSAPVLRRWAFKMRPFDWPLRSKTAMGSTCGCGSA
jgi:class 3 adenylate cyclase